MTSTSIYSASIPVSQSKTEIFISKAKIVHGELYNYVLTEYINASTKIKIDCEIHGTFEQTPNNHLSGQRCSVCARITQRQLLSSNSSTFIKKAKVVHGDFYNYDYVEYINRISKVKIECNIHGIFEQQPSNHLNGQNCPKCRNNRMSNISDKWLESLNISDMILEYRLLENNKKPVDGYSPSTNTVYQFHGDYWHGNPLKYKSTDINPSSKKSYGELYKKTIESDLWILSLDYNLVTMWESDYIQ